MIIGLGSDHGGYNLKQEIIAHLEAKGIECIDFGPDNASQSVDYPMYGETVADAVIKNKIDYGIVCCGTGIGISLAANKVPGIHVQLYQMYFLQKCKSSQ